MMDEVIAAMGVCKGITRHRQADGPAFGSLSTEHGLELPVAHREVLRWSNGIEAFFGYFRLFGLGSTDAIDAMKWNCQECWKFSWGDRCAPYWCFGETAWGDQYAYNVGQLRSGEGAVYFLDALSMTAEEIFGSFEEFFEREFARCARAPYDEMILSAYRAYGPIEALSHLVYVPSPLLGGEESIANVQKMSARAAMICNGDIATQLDQGPHNAQLRGLETYTDEHGQMRLRLIWA